MHGGPEHIRAEGRAMLSRGWGQGGRVEIRRGRQMRSTPQEAFPGDTAPASPGVAMQNQGPAQTALHGHQGPRPRHLSPPLGTDFSFITNVPVLPRCLHPHIQSISNPTGYP